MMARAQTNHRFVVRNRKVPTKEDRDKAGPTKVSDIRHTAQLDYISRRSNCAIL